MAFSLPAYARLQIYGCAAIGHLSGLAMAVTADLSQLKSVPKVAQRAAALVPGALRRVVAPVAGVVLRAVVVGLSSSLMPVLMAFTVCLSESASTCLP